MGTINVYDKIVIKRNSKKEENMEIKDIFTQISIK